MGYEAWVDNGIPETLDIRTDEWGKNNASKILVCDMTKKRIDLVQAYDVHTFTIKRFVTEKGILVRNLIGEFSCQKEKMSFYVTWAAGFGPVENWNPETVWIEGIIR